MRGKFILIENNKKNFEALQKEIYSLGKLPKGIRVNPHQEDYEKILRGSLYEMRQQQTPVFAFIDPYNFNIPLDLLNNLLEIPAVELFINFMYRQINMSVSNESQMLNLERLFGGLDWQYIQDLNNPEQRAQEIISLYSKQLHARYVTHMFMRAENTTLKYVLIHATNNDSGRQKMKDAIWKIKPDGSFSASERDQPDQLVLLNAEPNLDPLRDKIWREFAGKSIKSSEIEQWLLGELWQPVHLHQILREYKNKQIVIPTEYDGPFAFKKNPLFSFPLERPQNDGN